MLAAQIRTRFPALAAAAASAPPGSLLLMGVGGGSLFMELLFQNYTRFEVSPRLQPNPSLALCY
jgi:hypothetical protein